MEHAFRHEPVMLQECLAWLSVQARKVFVDGTVGGGGHAEAILRQSAPDGRLIGLDRDPHALLAASDRLAPFGGRVQLVHASFRNLRSVLAELGIEKVDGILLDLGVSSHQIDTAERGFRFAADTAADTPLDMRMDPSEPIDAATLLQSASQEEIEGWLRRYADLRGARRLARALVEARGRAPLRTSAELIEVIRASGIGRGRKHDPSTLVFQALRIATNDELGALEDGLEEAIEALRPGGRLVVLAYHSAEDRIVKHGLRAAERGCECPPRTPVCICGGRVRMKVLTRRPVGPSPDEVARNPRARSAHLRCAERVPEAA